MYRVSGSGVHEVGVERGSGSPSPRRGELGGGGHWGPVEAEGDGGLCRSFGCQAGVCKAWKAWQGLKGHRDAAGERVSAPGRFRA